MTAPVYLVDLPPRPAGWAAVAEALAGLARAVALLEAPQPTSPSPAETLLAYDAVARDLGMSVAYVRGLARDGQLPVVRLGSRRRIRRTDLEDFKARRVHRRK